MTTRLVTLSLVLAACAIGPDPKVEFRTIGAPEPAAPADAPARDDCPNGTAPLSNSYGTACWPRSEKEPPADHCRPARCPATGYLLWDCPVPVPDRDASGKLEEVETEEEIRWRCLSLIHELEIQRTTASYEAVRSCLRNLQARVGEDERRKIGEILRKYDARAKNLGYTPMESP